MTDHVLEQVLAASTPVETKIELYRHSQAINSARMGQLLIRYLERRRTHITFPAEGLEYDDIGPLKVTLSLSGEQLAMMHKSFGPLSLNEHQAQFNELVMRTLSSQFDERSRQRADELAAPGNTLLEKARELHDQANRLVELGESLGRLDGGNFTERNTAESLQQGSMGLRDVAGYYDDEGRKISLTVDRQREDAMNPRERKGILDRLERQVHRKLGQLWPMLSLPDDYYALLTDRPMMDEMAQGIFKPEEIDRLRRTGVATDKTIDHSDLAAFFYLHTMANGTQPRRYEHIVIDEAQDTSPLQFESLRRYSLNNSFTVLGDLLQSIYAHRGIASWDDVRAVYSNMKFSYHELRTSYRTTYQIMTFANSVPRSLIQKKRKIILAEPFKRNGADVGIHHIPNTQQMANEISQVVRQTLSDGIKNIAIITKTADRSRNLTGELLTVGLKNFETATSASFDYKGGVIVVPVHLAKGMEFEAVLVVDADETTYRDEFEGRLLYVAMTRALHSLHIFWVGNISTMLESVVPANKR